MPKPISPVSSQPTALVLPSAGGGAAARPEFPSGLNGLLTGLPINVNTKVVGSVNNKNVSLAAGSVFPENFLNKVRMLALDSPYASVTLGYGVKANYNPATNQVNFSFGIENTVSFRMDKNGNVVHISDWKGGPSSRELAIISAAGGIRPDVLTKLGVSPRNTQFEIQRHIEEMTARSQTLGRLTKNSLGELLPVAQYKGNKNNTVTVIQGEAAFIKPSGKTNGLLTHGAGPCAILVAVTHKDGQTLNVGLTHIDAVTPQHSIEDFIRRARGTTTDAQVRISLISGEESTALRINDAIKQAGGILDYSNIDPDGQRSDGVIVDKTGRIFYGTRLDLVMQQDPVKEQLNAMMRQLPGSPLDFLPDVP